MDSNGLNFDVYCCSVTVEMLKTLNTINFDALKTFKGQRRKENKEAEKSENVLKSNDMATLMFDNVKGFLEVISSKP